MTSSCTAELLNKWLPVFISETRTHSGNPYPPRSIHCILTGILRCMKAENANYPKFLEKNNPQFATFQASLDNLLKKLRSSGVGAECTQTEGISISEENRLWESGALNTDTPKGLLRAVFYYNGKCFCLRGGQEHRELAVSQLKRLHDPERYLYTENASKNRPGGVGQLKLQHKSVSIVANPTVGNRCHVAVLDKYLSKLPPEAITKDIFYCQPLSMYLRTATHHGMHQFQLEKIFCRKWCLKCVRKHRFVERKPTIVCVYRGQVHYLTLACLNVSFSKGLVTGQLMV